MNELALFAGAGGGILGGKQLGFNTVCAVENDAYAACVLAQQQNAGKLSPFPIWDDVRTFDGAAWRGHIDVVSGGFPCQDISAAGKGAGIEGAKSGLWKQMARIVAEVRPSFVFVENSDQLVKRGLGVVLADLAALGYDCRWTVLSAAAVGAPHIRKRLWLVAYSDRAYRARERFLSRSAAQQSAADHCPSEVANAESERCREARADCQRSAQRLTGSGAVRSNALGVGCEQVVEPIAGRAAAKTQLSATGHRGSATGRAWWQVEPELGRMADGVAHRVDRLRCLGNGQVPLCAATAWRLLVGAPAKLI
ncbi:MAG: DNA cytosine methyltransferase [Burkholderiaceae bacterium]